VDDCLQAAGTVVNIRQVLKTRLDHIPNNNNSHHSHVTFLAHPVRSILVQEACCFSFTCNINLVMHIKNRGYRILDVGRLVWNAIHHCANFLTQTFAKPKLRSKYLLRPNLFKSLHFLT